MYSRDPVQMPGVLFLRTRVCHAPTYAKYVILTRLALSRKQSRGATHHVAPVNSSGDYSLCPRSWVSARDSSAIAFRGKAIQEVQVIMNTITELSVLGLHLRRQQQESLELNGSWR